MKGCKIARRSGPLSREGSLLCHACCDTGPLFFQSRPKDRPIQSLLTTHRIYSNPDPQGSTFSRLLRHVRGCWGPNLLRILTGCICLNSKNACRKIYSSWFCDLVVSIKLIFTFLV
jgi:hypothetical protein